MHNIRFVIGGGLGNQLFQYAAYLYVKTRYPQYRCRMDFWQYRFDHYHNGIEIQKIFRTDAEGLISRINESQKFLGKFSKYKARISDIDAVWHKIRGFKTFYDKDVIKPEMLDSVISANKNITLGAFFQNSCFADIVKCQLTERLVTRLNGRNQSFFDSLAGKTLVSLHIRRGDYLAISDYHVFNGLNYYHLAIEYIKQNVENPHFVIFSDDIPWAKENLPLSNASYVEWNNGEESYQDLVLMSRCSHNIIANSSFSWWGAYLNQNPDKIVIAPKVWFKGKQTSEIVPSSWTLLEN